LKLRDLKKELLFFFQEIDDTKLNSFQKEIFSNYVRRTLSYIPMDQQLEDHFKKSVSISQNTTEYLQEDKPLFLSFQRVILLQKELESIDKSELSQMIANRE